MSLNPSSAAHRADDSKPPEDDGARDIETLRILRFRKASRPSFRVLVWDALLGIALGVLVTVMFSLMFKPFQWLTAGVTSY